MFYTRIPCPKGTGGNSEHLKKSIRYFPLIGWIVGSVAAGIFIASDLVLDEVFTMFIPVLVSVLLTGAFHEDGLADICDGFGGGWTKKDILTIMKDSRIGTYGTIAVVLSILIRIAGFADSMSKVQPTLNQYLAIFAILISANSVSRLMAYLTMINRPYARLENSKSKDIVTEVTWGSKDTLIAILLGISPLILFMEPTVFLVLIPMGITTYLLGRYYNKKIGGYTGDCLGAVQQITEVVFYLSLAVIWKYI